MSHVYSVLSALMGSIVDAFHAGYMLARTLTLTAISIAAIMTMGLITGSKDIEGVALPELAALPEKPLLPPNPPPPNPPPANPPWLLAGVAAAAEL